MPLHLLGQKSWNVYNRDNIDRVRRDEAEAQVKEEAEEQRMQAVDAERRLQLLRGGTVQALGNPSGSIIEETRKRPSSRSQTKRRRTGEDDTQREIRLAEEVAREPVRPSGSKPRREETALVDACGHISLFSEEEQFRTAKNMEAEAEKARKKRELEDQYTMRLSNAAGTHAGADKPWYASTTAGGSPSQMDMGKDVWGSEDPQRKEREKQRVNANDPLAAMRRGVKQLKEIERHRQEWRLQRERDLNGVEDLARRERKRKSRRGSDEGSLEDFNLDQPSDRPSSAHRHRKHHRKRLDRIDRVRDDYHAKTPA